MKISKKVFYYEIKNDRWLEAPSMLMPRYHHISCILGNSLYVCGGSNDFGFFNKDCSTLPIQRLANINKGAGEASDCWESLQISFHEDLIHFMAPLNHSEKILILATGTDSGHPSVESIYFDPIKSVQEVMASNFELNQVYF